MWKYYNPVKIIFSDAFYEEVKNLTQPKKKILIVCENWFCNTNNFFNLKEQLSSFKIFFDIENNPSFKSCQVALDLARDFRPDFIIAIGGGSVIDTAKVIRMALYTNCFEIENLFSQNSFSFEAIELVAVPTTHGTGSEVTMWATVWDKKNKKKHSLSNPINYPDYAVYDANLLKTLPIENSFSVTLDALSHSFEALWNKNSNPVSDLFSLKAISLIVSNLDKLIEPVPVQVRKNLLYGSMYAGLAFSNTKTAAAHSISYPLSLHFKIPHGIACSMPLYSLLKINQDSIKDKIAKLLETLGLRDINELWERIQKSVKNKIAFRLADYGVEDADLKELVDLSFTKGRMDNNIVDLNKNDVLKILKEIY